MFFFGLFVKVKVKVFGFFFLYFINKITLPQLTYDFILIFLVWTPGRIVSTVVETNEDP